MLGIADDIFIVGYDSSGADHDRMPCRVLQICRKKNPERNEDKFQFWCTSVPFLGEIISRQGVRIDLRKLKALTDMPILKIKKE